jgi:hypothetical protein
MSKTAELLVDIQNPFSDTIVANPWAEDYDRIPDVKSIHNHIFRQILGLLREIPGTWNTSMLVAGPAGSGKTFLIARLFRHLQKEEKPPLLCYIGLGDVPQQAIWSHVRRRLFEDLLTKQDKGSRTGLDRLLEHRVPDLFEGIDTTRDQSLIGLLLGNSSGKKLIRERLASQLFSKHNLDLDPDLEKALLKYFSDQPSHVKLAQDWLKGGQLTDKELDTLGIAPVDLADYQYQVRCQQIVLSVLKLTTTELPLLLCFDQVEGLQRNRTDLVGFLQFGHVIAAMREIAPKGLFLLTFALSEHVQSMKDTLGSAWVRLAQHCSYVKPITLEEASELVLGRMNHFPKLRVLLHGKNEPFWPLTRTWLAATHHKTRHKVTARTFLSECYQEFNRLAEREEGDFDLCAYLLQKWQQVRLTKANDPSVDRLLRVINAVEWLCELFDAPWKLEASNKVQDAIPDVSLVLRSSDGKQHVAFSPCPRDSVLWRRFTRLKRDWAANASCVPGLRLVALNDTPIKKLSAATKAHAEELGKLKDVTLAAPDLAKLLDLDALHSLFREAVSGLSHEGRTITAEEVQNWARVSLESGLSELTSLRELFDDLGFALVSKTKTTSKAKTSKPKKTTAAKK